MPPIPRDLRGPIPERLLVSAMGLCSYRQVRDRLSASLSCLSRQKRSSTPPAGFIGMAGQLGEDGDFRAYWLESRMPSPWRQPVITQALATATARQLEDELRAQRLSSRELLDTYLKRIDQLDPPINAVVTLDRERAYAASARADDAAVRGDWLGPLHGLPITIKDAIEVSGLRSTGGATELAEYVPTVDAPSVARLKSAGAIVFGKTNVPRWSGDVQTFNHLFGTTNNPWSLDRVPGGSSGGPAAAVACGFTAFELGTDIGGSVRIPAHCCGVFGLKPSYGVMSQRGYLDHVGGGTTDADINVFGPIARSADDLGLLLDVLGGPAPEDAVAWRLDLPAALGSSLSDYRIGLWLDDPDCAVDREYEDVLQTM